MTQIGALPPSEAPYHRYILLTAHDSPTLSQVGPVTQQYSRKTSFHKAKKVPNEAGGGP